MAASAATKSAPHRKGWLSSPVLAESPFCDELPVGAGALVGCFGTEVIVPPPEEFLSCTVNVVDAVPSFERIVKACDPALSVFR